MPQLNIRKKNQSEEGENKARKSPLTFQSKSNNIATKESTHRDAEGNRLKEMKSFDFVLNSLDYRRVNSQRYREGGEESDSSAPASEDEESFTYTPVSYLSSNDLKEIDDTPSKKPVTRCTSPTLDYSNPRGKSQQQVAPFLRFRHSLPDAYMRLDEITGIENDFLGSADYGDGSNDEAEKTPAVCDMNDPRTNVKDKKSAVKMFFRGMTSPGVRGRFRDRGMSF